MALGFFDVFGPALMVTDRVDAETDNLGVAFVEFGLEPGHITEFSGADRGEVLRV
ncbi:hypothetical protein D3C84_1308710 [compost metagenome]